MEKLLITESEAAKLLSVSTSIHCAPIAHCSRGCAYVKIVKMAKAAAASGTGWPILWNI